MKLWSQFFIPTLKESPADAEITSHKLLLRAGLVRKLGGGLYTYLPLGLRVAAEDHAALPRGDGRRGRHRAVDAAPASGGILAGGAALGRGARDHVPRRLTRAPARRGRRAEPEFVLGPTHEEIITPLVKSEITSYRDLPKNFYQIATKFRNEIRPRYGLMRAREFVMKDAYSFDADDEGATRSYHAMEAAYTKFFARCGLKTISVEADTGVMGGSFSHEFMVPAEVGDDDVVYCEEGGYAANRQKATSGLVPADLPDAAPAGAARGVSHARASSPSPRSRRRLTGCRPTGSSRRCSTSATASCSPSCSAAATNSRRPSSARSASPCGVPPRRRRSSPSWARSPAASARCAARSRTPARSPASSPTMRSASSATASPAPTATASTCATSTWRATWRSPEFGDFRRVREGEPCPKSGRPLQICRAIEVGHVFKLGTKYSEKFGAVYTDDAEAKPAHGHGLLRHRHQPDAAGRDRAVPRRRRHRLAVERGAVPGARRAARSAAARGRGTRPEARRARPRRPAPTCCWTTGPSARGSSSRTPI